MSHINEFLTPAESNKIDEETVEKIDRHLENNEAKMADLEEENSQLKEKVESLEQSGSHNTQNSQNIAENQSTSAFGSGLPTLSGGGSSFFGGGGGDGGGFGSSSFFGQSTNPFSTVAGNSSNSGFSFGQNTVFQHQNQNLTEHGDQEFSQEGDFLIILKNSSFA